MRTIIAAFLFCALAVSVQAQDWTRLLPQPGGNLPYYGSPAQPYHGQNDTFQYNGYEGRFERAQPGSTLQYNGYEGTWGYHQPGYQPQYNGHTGRWE